MQCLALRQAYVSAPVRVARRSRAGAVSRRMLVVKAHEEEEVLPIWSGRVEVPDPETLHRGPMLGGKTLGEELVLLREAYNKEEHDKEAEMETKLYSSNWQGDVYVGSNWNMLTLITGLMFFVPVLGLLFAYLSYGTLWTGHYYGI